MRQDSAEAIGERLAHIRAASSQKDHAEKLGVPLRTYQNYERGEREPDLRTYLGLLAGGWNINWLLTGAGAERLANERVGEESEAYGASPPLRQDAYILAVTMIDEALAAKGMTLEPRKRAEAYYLLAEVIAEGDELPNAKVISLALKSVA